ncbi:endonuclease III [Acetivibrio clariflavus]|uniref:Endonuclease III n=1 Tax=Acetivibrio clariflavus (strain DSM 19732 / NBRC 101661 / EBR45) TaxID=720554 RepID=G8LXT9_ACECE|nr:endonuclease III [Acetivibrio clariflavus]AEV68842.1 endonuclease III, DNA-(apurinic or apyrimidinic site) lyase [Acetivibrio clariflavus DSM 19732]
MDKKSKVIEIIKIFDKLYSDADCTLDYKDPLQLLISTQLAAQCTDARVNIVTQSLYKKYKTVYDFANADLSELEQDIKPTGFYRNKARNIKETCRILIEKFDGKVPDNLDDLLTLPGVGRKTANLVLGDVYGIPGIVVDTHAKRLSNRIGLSKNEDPVKIEYDLMKIVPKERWGKFCHQLVYHGRAVCNARKPKCEECAILNYCDYGTERISKG